MRALRHPSAREKIHEGGMFEQMMNDPGCSCQITPCIECPACSYEVPPPLLFKCPNCGHPIGEYTHDGIEPFAE